VGTAPVRVRILALVTGTSTLTAAEVDELRRAAAVGPLDPADVRRVLESLREVLAERAELVAPAAAAGARRGVSCVAC
jgi:hypothetical protein